MGQLGQRIGTAVGTAVALSLFYSAIYRDQGSDRHGIDVFHDAYAYGMISVAAFLLIAFALGVFDLVARRHSRR